MISYDEESGFSGLISSIKRLKELPEITNEVKNGFDLLFKENQNLNNWVGQFDLLSKHLNVTDKTFAEFLETTQKSGTVYNSSADAMAGYQKWLQSTSRTTSLATIKTQALSVAIKALSSIGWTLLITGALEIGKAVIKWIDGWHTTVEEAKEIAEQSRQAFEEVKSEIESLNSELETTSNRIDELNAKQNLSLVEAEELQKLKATNEELERELRIKQAIADEKGKTANGDAVDYFNTMTDGVKRTYYTNDGQVFEDPDYQTIETFKMSNNVQSQLEQVSALDSVQQRLEKISELENELTELRKEQEKIERSSPYYKQDTRWQQINANISNNKERIDEYKEYLQTTITDFMEEDDSLIEGMDNGILKRLDGIYSLYDEVINGIAQSHTSEIEAVLDKVEFAGFEDKLLSLGKIGTLSVERLKSEFSGLIDYLEQAGITAEELYYYITHLVNPDAKNYGEIRKQLFNSLPELDIKNPVQMPTNIAEQQREAAFEGWMKKNGFDTPEALDAYFVIKTRFADGGNENWNWDDWAYNIQQEMNEALSKTEVQLSISSTITELDTQLKPAFDSLKTAYQSIFTDDGFKGAVGSEVLAPIQDAVNSFNESSAVDVSTEQFEEFSKVLSDTGSTAEDVQSQFNKLASSFINSSDLVYTGQNLDILRESLESMGVINVDEIFGKITQAQEEITAEGYDLINMSEEEVIAFINTAKASEFTVEYLRNYQIQKALAENPMSTADDISNLENLCKSLGITGEMYFELARLKAIYNSIENGSTYNYSSAIDEIKSNINSLAQTDYSVEWNFDGGKVEKDADKTADKLKDLAKDVLDAQLNYLKVSLDQARITVDQYASDVKKLLDDAHSAGTIDDAEYWGYVEDSYKNQLNIMDRISDAVQKRIDKEIKFYQNQKDDIQDKYDLEIKALEEQKSLLEEQRKAREDQLALEQALYNLRRAESQRSIGMYREGEGKVYVADGSVIRDAQDEVENTKTDIQISKIESQISKLEEACQKEVDSLDEVIQNLENYKEQWASVSSEYEDKQNELLLAQEFGANAENDILSLRTDILNKFADNYINKQREMADAAIKSAEAQVEAAKYAQSNGVSGSIDRDNTQNDTTQEQKYIPSYKVVDAKGNVLADNITTEEMAYKARNSLMGQGSNSKKGLRIEYFHTGLKQGLVSDKDNERNFSIIEKYGLKIGEVPAILKQGEAVINQLQMQNLTQPLRMFEAMTNNLATAPDTSYLKNIQNNRNSTQNITINASFPNITNETGYDSFERNMSKFFNEANLASVQYKNKR